MIYYVYAYLDPRKPISLVVDTLTFNFEPFYIGKGKKDRLTAHLTDTRSGNFLKRQKIERIKLAGYDPIIVKLVEHLSEDNALALEKRLIRVIGTKWSIKEIPSGPLCNMTSGGDGYSLSEEQKQKLRDQNSGERNKMFGRSHSESARHLISEYRKKFKHTEETKTKYRESRKNGNNNNARRWIIVLPTEEQIKVFDLAGDCEENGFSYGTLYTSYQRNQAITRGKLKGYRLIEDSGINVDEIQLERTA